MKRIIKFTAASSMLRELLKNGYNVTHGAERLGRDAAGKLTKTILPRAERAVAGRANLTGDTMQIGRGDPLSTFWHESGHAVDLHGTEDGLARYSKYADAQAARNAGKKWYKPQGNDLNYSRQTRDIEIRANRTAEAVMTERGATPEYVQKFRNEVAPHLNSYRNAYPVDDPALAKAKTALRAPSEPSGNPANPPGNPGTPIAAKTPSADTAPESPQPKYQNNEPIKRNFGGALAVGGIAAAGLGIASAGKKPKDDYEGQTFRSKLKAIQFAANPLFREGIKSGTHRLGGIGVEKKVRIRDIVSPQALVDEKKVAKLARFTKNMPGKATVSWNGKNWIAKDGNHRLNAMLKQGKRKATVLVQKLSSQQPVIQFGMFIRNGRVYRDALISPHSILPTDAASFAELGHKRKKAMDYAARWTKGSTPPKISTGGIDADTGKIYATEGHHRVMAAKHLDKMVPAQISYRLGKTSEALSEERKAARKLLGLSSPSPLIQFSRIGQAIRKHPKTAIAAGVAAGVGIGAVGAKAAGEMHKHAWNEHQPDRGGRSPEEIAAHYKKLYPTAYLSGSSALKIGIPNSSDVDVHIPTRSVASFKRIERHLKKTLEPSAYYKPGYDHAGFTGKMDGRPIDVAVTYGDKGFKKRDAIRRVASELTDEDRQHIIATKQKLKKAWIAPEARYHAYKRGLDLKHGIPLWRAEKLPEQQMSAIELGAVSIGTAKKVLAELRGSSAPKMLRPKRGFGGMYVPPNSPPEMLTAIESNHWIKKGDLAPHSVVVPRDEKSPLFTALHEHGHAADPKQGRLHAAIQTAYHDNDKARLRTHQELTTSMRRAQLISEKRANRNVLQSIDKHGSSKEVAAYRSEANNQMKHGYRVPWVNDIARQKIGYGKPSISDRKQVLRENPWLRKERVNLHSLRQLIQFDDDLQPHQQRVIRRLLNPKTRGLVVAHGVGSGKTRTSIEAHKALGGDADVVLPAALKGNYEKEIAKWGGDPARTHIQSQQALATSGEPLNRNLLIVDEAHRARNPQTKIARAISESPAKKRLLLTGTGIYNKPSDIATLVNQAAGKGVLREGKAFDNRYLKPGIFKRWAGGRLSHEGELKKHLNDYVDYHKGDPAFLPKVTAKTIPVDMGKRQTELYRASMGRIPKGVKVNKENIDKLKAYFTGPRQVSNTSNSLEPGSNEEPKIDKAFSDLKAHLANPKGKALVYSNWLDHGITPMRRRLEKEGISHGVFTGDESMKERNQTVRDYNEGKHRALLVSSSGAEGLDLKGTRMVQVLEPHFNNAKIRQVVGRSARMNSHAHLDPEDRNVEVRQYIGRPRNRFLPGTGKGVEDMLSESARDKDEIEKQINRLLSSKRKLIQFARGDRLREALSGSEYDSPEGKKITDALFKHKAQWSKGQKRGAPGSLAAYQSALGTGVASVGKVEAHREVDASGKAKAEGIQAGSKEAMAIHKQNVLAKARTGFTVSKKVVRENAAGFTEQAGRPSAIQQSRKAIEKRLPEMIAGVRKNLNDKKVYGPHPTIPDMVAEREGVKVPGLVSKEREKFQNRAAKTRSILHHQIKTKLRAEPDFQPGGKWHTEDVRYRKGVEEELGRRADQYLEGSIDKPAVAQRAFNKPLSPENITKNKANHYGPLAEVLGIHPDKAEKIHHNYLRRKNPEPQRLIKTILASPGREAFAEVKIPKRSSGLPTSFPTLKKVGIGAGVLGAGLLASKLLKKKEEQKMSARGRVIRFGRYERILKNPNVKKLLMKKGIAEGRTDLVVRPVDLGAGFRKKGAVGSFEKFHYPQGHPLHSHAAEQYSAASPMPAKAIDARQWTAAQNGRAARAHAADAGLYGTPDASIMRSPGHQPDGQMQREIEAGIASTLKRKPEDQVPWPLYLTDRKRRIKTAVTRVIAAKNTQAERKLADQASAHQGGVQRALNEQSAIHNTQMKTEKSKAKRRLLIGTSAGLGIGSVGGYIATRPPKELEFSARKIPAFSLNAAKRNIKSAWGDMNTAQRIGVPAAWAAGSVVDAAAAVMTKGGSAWNPIGANKILPALAHKALKSRERIDPLGRSMGGFMPRRAGNADGYFKPQQLSAKGDILRFDVSPIQNLRNKLRPEEKSTAAHDIATGSLEGSVGGLAFVPVEHRILQGTWKNPLLDEAGKFSKGALAKRLAIGGVIGGVATGLIGAGVSAVSKKKRDSEPVFSAKQKLIHFDMIAPGTRTRVATDRYVKQIHERDMDRTESGYLRTGLGGAAIGALTAKRFGTTKSKAALIGGLAGLGTQAIVRQSTKGTKDQFGDRSFNGKRADRAPSQIAGIAALGLAGKAAHDKLQAAKVAASGMARKAKIAGLAGLGLWGASKLFSANQKPIEFGKRERDEIAAGAGVGMMGGVAIGNIRAVPDIDEWSNRRREGKMFARRMNTPTSVEQAKAAMKYINEPGKKAFRKIFGGAAIGAAIGTGAGVLSANHGRKQREKVRRFSAKGSNDLIKFDDAPEAPEGYRLIKHTKVKPRHWTKKWLADDINVERRSADLRTAANRTSAVFKDIGGALKGEAAVDARGRPRKREWDKPWANALKWTAVVGATAAGVKGVKHMAENPGIIAEAAEFARRGGIQQAASNTLRKSKTISKVMDWVGDKAAKMKQEGKGLTESIASRALGGLKKAAGDIPRPPHYDLPTKVNQKVVDGKLVGGEDTVARFKQGSPQYERHHESLLTPDGRAAAQAARAKKKADEIAIKNQGLKKDPHAFSVKSSPIQFQKLSKDEYEDELAAYQQETGKEFRKYHLNSATVRHAALHPAVIQRKPRDPNRDSNEQRKWRARYKMAGAFVLGTGLGAFGFKRPGVVTKNSAPIMASSKDPLIELNSILDAALT